LSIISENVGTIDMPVTPLHYPLAYLLKKAGKGRLSLPALTVGALLVDLENPFVYLLSGGRFDRLVLHSLVGAALVGIPLALAVLILVYRRLAPPIFHVDREALRRETSLSWSLVLSAFLGLESHVFLDLLHHPYNPLFYPFTLSSFKSLILFGDVHLASIIVSGVMGAALLLIVLRNIRLGHSRFWDRLLVK
jgi:hypothetical protein